MYIFSIIIQYFLSGNNTFLFYTYCDFLSFFIQKNRYIESALLDLKHINLKSFGLICLLN